MTRAHARVYCGARTFAFVMRSEVRPGSMGQPLPGFSCAVLHNDRDEPAPAGTPGRIAVDMTASPLAHFTGYHGNTGTTGRLAPGGRWYLTGDAGYADAGGHYFFSARDDDVIIMASYRIGPFDVESVLVTHDQVIEAAVIGVPDQLRGEVIEAFVVLRHPSEGTEELVGELQQLVKEKFAAYAYPAGCISLRRCPRSPAARFSDTSFAGNVPDPLRRDTARRARTRMKINRRRLGPNLQGIALAGHRNLRFIPGRVPSS